MQDSLAARLRDLGVDGYAELRGYVPVEDGLSDLYLHSHAFLHVSWTEGFPQVLLEAFAAGLPTVATAVGGIEEWAADGALLIPPGDAGAAADALQRVAAESELRKRLIAAERELALRHTASAECARVAEALKGTEVDGGA
jgi:glycosyltransferase involved in cell wall biosynthesis